VICFCSAIVAALLSLLLRPTIRNAIALVHEHEEGLKAVKPPTDVVQVEVAEALQPTGLLGWLRRTLDTNVDELVAENATTSQIHMQVR
jgi:hypothetical protein